MLVFISKIIFGSVALIVISLFMLFLFFLIFTPSQEELKRSSTRQEELVEETILEISVILHSWSCLTTQE